MTLLRGSERLVIAYFLLAALRTAGRGRWLPAMVDLCVPLVFAGLAWAEQRSRRLGVSVARDWMPMAFLLLAYWNVDWTAGPVHSGGHEQRWVVLDRMLLDRWGGRALIESCGALFPSILELAYALLYAIPPLVMGGIYLSGRRREAERFLFPLLAGALTAYALLPLFPSVTPRVLFPDQDLPGILTVFRRLNLWVLDTLDIQASVFPSGHVAVAFSAALGANRVFPDRRWVGRALALFAALVAVNTVYARYHYAVDGAAGAAIACVAYGVSVVRERRSGAGRLVAAPAAEAL